MGVPHANRDLELDLEIDLDDLEPSARVSDVSELQHGLKNGDDDAPPQLQDSSSLSDPPAAGATEILPGIDEQKAVPSVELERRPENAGYIEQPAAIEPERPTTPEVTATRPATVETKPETLAGPTPPGKVDPTPTAKQETTQAADPEKLPNVPQERNSKPAQNADENAHSNKEQTSCRSAAAPLQGGQTDDAELHPVKAKLLARAAEARRARQPSAAPSEPLRLDVELPTDQDEAQPRGLPRRARSFDEELGKIGRPMPTSSRPPSVAQLQPRRGQLSPQLIAIFGTLLGLALIASLTALAVNLDANRSKVVITAPATTAAPAVDSTPPTVQKPERKKMVGPWRIADVRSDANFQIVEGDIGKKPFLRAVQDAGLEKRQAYRVLTVLKGLRDLEKCAHTDHFVAALERSSRRVKAFEYIVRPEEVYQAREGTDGLLQAKALDLKLERGQVRGVILIDGSFAQSAKRAGFDSGLAETVREALDGHMRLEDFQAGDLVRVIAQEVTVLGEFARYAGIEALEYRPKDGSEPLRLYYLQTPQAKAHYDAHGRAPYEGGWRIPVEGARITSKFNPHRMHPILKKLMPHTGTDFGANKGDLVGASSYGTVTFIGWGGPSGNLVKVMHPGNIETGYAHLSRFAEGLKVGDKVKRMQLVGYVGSTGRSTAPHLHFSAKRDGVFIDAETLKLNAMRVLPAADRPAFELVKTRYDQLLDAIELPAMPAPDPANLAPAKPNANEAPANDPAALDPELDEAEPQGANAAPAAAVQPTAPAAAVQPAAPNAQTPAPNAAPPPAAPANTPPSALQLSDEELLKLQGATDDGEVAQ